MFALPRTRTGKPSGRDRVELEASCLDAALTVTGRLDSDGEIQIYGTVSGRISADSIVLGATCVVVGGGGGRPRTRIGGRFSGRVVALDVTLDASAQIEGKIFHHNVTVARGAQIVGRMPWRPLNYFDSLKQLPEIQP
jgi:cytoskeletal protein CcmA (bactofilin family)